MSNMVSFTCHTYTILTGYLPNPHHHNCLVCKVPPQEAFKLQTLDSTDFTNMRSHFGTGLYFNELVNSSSLSRLNFVSFQFNGDSRGTSKEGTNYFIGLLAVFSATLTSGFAGIYNEKLLKDGRQPILLIRSFQLGKLSIRIISNCLKFNY